MSYVYIAITVILTVYGQLIIKWQASLAGLLPSGNKKSPKIILKSLQTPSEKKELMTTRKKKQST